MDKLLYNFYNVSDPYAPPGKFGLYLSDLRALRLCYFLDGRGGYLETVYSLN